MPLFIRPPHCTIPQTSNHQKPMYYNLQMTRPPELRNHTILFVQSACELLDNFCTRDSVCCLVRYMIWYISVKSLSSESWTWEGRVLHRCPKSLNSPWLIAFSEYSDTSTCCWSGRTTQKVDVAVCPFFLQPLINLVHNYTDSEIIASHGRLTFRVVAKGPRDVVALQDLGFR